MNVKKVRIAVLCPSEIAFRRFMPSLNKLSQFEFVGVAYANELEWFGDVSSNNQLSIIENEEKKATKFAETYGGIVFDSYKSLLTSDSVDAVYIPLPPALHFKWAEQSLINGKHVLLEKPFTTSLEETKILLDIARSKKIAVHENYMFQYHSQLEYVKDVIACKTIGELRLIRINFGFPFRGTNDFRYVKALGGGALLDCGGYTLKLASMMLGESAYMVTSSANYKNEFDVDIYGSATISNDQGLTAQVSFGMDNSYKCELEVWGSKGSLYTNRILTAPDGYQPVVTIKSGIDEMTENLASDDSFAKSILAFYDCIKNSKLRLENYEKITKQAILIDEFTKGAIR